MSALPTLTTGCLETIMTGTEYQGEPIFQVLGTKRIASGGNQERYRVLLSDGKYLQSFAMLSTQLNDMVTSGALSEHSIIQVKQHITSVVNKNDQGDKRVLIIVALDVLKKGEDVGRKIGDPITLTDTSSKAKAPTASAAAPTSTATTQPGSYSVPPRPAQSQASSNMNETVFDGRATHPISGLSPYQNKWVIKARVTSKSAIRSWNNAKGEGRLFSMDLMDESGQIRVTAFRDQVDKFYDLIEVDKVYYITKCQLKPANKQYSNIPNDYEMTMTNDTLIQECPEQADIPAVKYEFVPISQLATLETNAIVDVIGVCKDVGDLTAFTAKSSGRELKKRELTLVDQSNASINLTLWGADAETFSDQSQPVILIKAGRINEFNGGKTIAMSNGSVLKINPDCVEGHRLRGWFDNGGNAESVQSVSARTSAGGNMSTEWLSFFEAKQRNLGNGDKPDYYQLKGIIHIVKANNAIYKACPQTDCNKKVVDMENGNYRCEKCNAQFTNFKYRLMVNMSVGDWTSNRWVTAFAKEAEAIYGKSSDEIGKKLEDNHAEGEAFLNSVNFKSLIFKLRTKVEFYGDSSRNKVTVQSVTPIVFKDYNNYLINNLQRLTGIGKH